MDYHSSPKLKNQLGPSVEERTDLGRATIWESVLMGGLHGLWFIFGHQTRLRAGHVSVAKNKRWQVGGAGRGANFRGRAACSGCGARLGSGGGGLRAGPRPVVAL